MPSKAFHLTGAAFRFFETRRSLQPARQSTVALARHTGYSSMTITDLRHALEPLGWRFDGTHLTSPSGGYWLSELMLGSPIQVYGPVARRWELFRHECLGGAQEYQDLLRALEADPEVSLLASQVRTMAEVATPWVADHGAAVSLWDFSLPAVRATARHPVGGMACIECEVHCAATVSVAAIHWCDDYANGVRSGWTHPLPTTELSARSLRVRLDEALSLLLEPRDMTLYTYTNLEGTAGSGALAPAWENGFAVLH